MTTTENPDTTLGWQRGRLNGATAYWLEDTDLIAQRDEDGWSLYIEHEIHGAQWLEAVDTWTDVLVWVNCQPRDAMLCGNFG